MFKKIILIMMTIFIFAQPSYAEDELVLTKQEQADLIRFVSGNTIWTMFHETGHALVSLFDIPILGKEEDAVDNLATIIMLLQENDQADEYLKQTALGWFLLDEFSDIAGEELNFSDDHSLDQQRAYQTICFLYGADKQIFGEFAKMMEMPEQRLENCAYDFDRTLESWDRVLAPYILKPGDKNLAVKIAYGSTTDALKPYKDLLQDSQILENIQDFIVTNYKIPTTFTLKAETCDDANAYWDAEAKQVILCYELMAEFEKLFIFDIKQAIAQGVY